MSYTPGPWKAERWGAILGSRKRQFVRGTVHLQVAMATLAGDIDDVERDANARLMAAAPELLEALKAARAWGLHEECAGKEAVEAQMDAAIAKAEHVTSDQ